MKIKHPIGLAFLGLCLWLLFWPSEKDHLNKQMAELCKKDGGVRIYERVKLSPEMFNEWGGLKNKKFTRQNNKDLMLIGNDYILIEESIYIKKGDLQKNEGVLLRTHSEIRRTTNNTLLAEAVQYGRAGGDRWSAGMHSIDDCPNEPIDLFNKVFSKEGAAK